jgi:hypothetical protein
MTNSSRSLRVMVVQGHRNTSGGNPREMARTPGAARAIVAALNAAGHRAECLQPQDDWFPGSLDAVAQEVMARHRREPIDLMLDVHFEGDAGNTRGVFAIVPDGDGLRTLTPYAGSDAIETNPLDHTLAREVAQAVARTTGLPLRRTNVVEAGVMSERQTYVGADLGWRLAMFGYTAPARDRMARLVLECGNIRGDAAIIDGPRFNERLAQGVVEGIARALGFAPDPVPLPIVSRPVYPLFGTSRQLATPRLMTVMVDALNARAWAETDQPIRGVWKYGRRFWVRGWIIGESVDGNPVWWITGKGVRTDLQWRVWSGGTDLAGEGALALDVMPEAA